jgi:hypothetical protein
MGPLEESLFLLRLFPDFGCLILVLMVQLAIYPSFNYFDDKGILAWHQKYTRQITFLIMPLMLAQLTLSFTCLLYQFTLSNALVLAFIILIWVLTFTMAIPAHNRINSDKRSEMVSILLKVNAWRCILWSAIFIINAWTFISLN